jgi:hypothetical protein
VFIAENLKGGPVVLLTVKLGSFSEIRGLIKALLAVKYRGSYLF